MELFDYLMAKKGHNTGGDLFSYLLGKNAGGSGTYTTFSGITLNIASTLRAKIKNFMLNPTELTQDGTPTPDNPVDVNVIKGENNVKVENKNLLNFTFTNPIEKNGITFTKNNDGSLTLNGTATTTFSQVFNITHQILNGTYSIKHNVLNGTTSENSYLSIQKSPSGNISDRVYGGTTSSTFNITEDTTIITASLYITSGTTFTDYNVGSQLEIGSTATEYIGHQEQNYPISLSSKNIFDIDDFVTQMSSLVNITNVDGVITIKRSSSTSVDYLLNCKENTQYTISMDFLNNNTNYYIKFYYSNNTSNDIVGSTSYSDFTKITATSSANKTLTSINFQLYGYNNNIQMKNIQLEEGTTATSYEAYYNLEYCKIGDYKDQIFKNTTNSPYYDNTLLENEWYLKKNIDKIDSYNGETITTSYISTTGGLDTGATVYYVLATPQYIHISETDYPTLKTELDNLYNNAKSYDGQTNITQTNDDLPFNISVDVKVKTE